MAVPFSDSTSLGLLNRVRENDASAWSRLCRIYAPLVYGWCRRAGLQDSDAHDVGQEVFQVLHRRISSFRREAPGESFRGWLHGVTRNKLREHFRRRQSAAFGDEGRGEPIADALDAGEEPGDDDQAAGEDAAVMRRALQTIRHDFDDATWHAFWRMTIDEQSSAAIAAELGVTCGAVRQAKFRVLRRLRQELEGLL
jgi:RNA polymerase sigma-70 factor (ECF subfamily)